MTMLSGIGKYSEQRTRPLSVRFARSCDAATVLSNRHKIPKEDHPNVFIKPFMSISERKTESTLLKERRTLIDSGVERRFIRIRGNSIYINKTKVGSASEDIFIRNQQLQHQLQSPKPIPTCCDTNNVKVLSANATNPAAPPNDNDVRPTTEEHSQRLQLHERPCSSSPLPTNSN